MEIEVSAKLLEVGGERDVLRDASTHPTRRSTIMHATSQLEALHERIRHHGEVQSLLLLMR